MLCMEMESKVPVYQEVHFGCDIGGALPRRDSVFLMSVPYLHLGRLEGDQMK